MPERGRIHALIVRAVLAPIRLYRRRLSPLLPPRCRFHPTCSAYAEQAIRELGVVRGSIVSLWRMARCTPFGRGGYDPLEDRRLFRSTAAAHRAADGHEHVHARGAAS